MQAPRSTTVREAYDAIVVPRAAELEPALRSQSVFEMLRYAASRVRPGPDHMAHRARVAKTEAWGHAERMVTLFSKPPHSTMDLRASNTARYDECNCCRSFQERVTTVKLASRQKGSEGIDGVHRVTSPKQLKRGEPRCIFGEGPPLRLARTVSLHDRKFLTERGTGQRIE